MEKNTSDRIDKKSSLRPNLKYVVLALILAACSQQIQPYGTQGEQTIFRNSMDGQPNVVIGNESLFEKYKCIVGINVFNKSEKPELEKDGRVIDLQYNGGNITLQSGDSVTLNPSSVEQNENSITISCNSGNGVNQAEGPNVQVTELDKK